MNRKEAPIGIMDSGVGGVSVLREIVRLMPEEDCIYYGDCANAPYGTKTPQEVRDLTFQAVRVLLEHGVKAIVIACNTATSAAISALREYYRDIPVIGIEPALKPAAEEHAGSRILVMATPMTLKEEKFHHLMEHYSGQTQILPVSSEGLMEFVEKGILDGPELESFLRRLLLPYLPADSIVLGCTHYPFVKKIIARVAGQGTRILDGGAGTAREVKRRLEAENLRRDTGSGGQIVFYSSEDTQKMEELCRRLMKNGD